MKRLIVGALAWALLLTPAFAADKTPLANYGGGAIPIKPGDTLQAPAPTTANASINLPQGTAPSSPTNGDIWLTTAGMYARVNGSTVGPFGSGGSGTVTSVICGTGLSGGTITTTGTCSLTAPVTVALGGTNATSASGTALDNISGFASTGFLTRTGAGAYSFQSLTNGISLGNIAQIAANTVLGNATASTANAAPLPMPSCSAASSALTWTTSSGFGCNTISGTGTVTTTGSPASGNLAKFSGSTSVTSGDLSGDVTTSGTLATTIASNAVTTSKINNAAVTYAKIQNVSASSVLLGAGASGSGAAPVEIALGTGLSMSGTTLQATGAGSVGAIVLITETVTSGSAANVTFTSIPGTYRDLVVKVRGRGDTAATLARVLIQLNSDTGTNYSWTFFQNTNTGSSGAEYHSSATFIECGYITAATSPSNVPGGTIINVLDYKGTTFDKAVQCQSNLMTANSSPNMFNGLFSGWWLNTAAVTSVKVFLDAGNFANGSVVSLYGHY